jgi:hypothetical protein
MCLAATDRVVPRHLPWDPSTSRCRGGNCGLPVMPALTPAAVVVAEFPARRVHLVIGGFHGDTFVFLAASFGRGSSPRQILRRTRTSTVHRVACSSGLLHRRLGSVSPRPGGLCCRRRLEPVPLGTDRLSPVRTHNARPPDQVLCPSR